MPYKWIVKFKNWVNDGFQEMIVESISGEWFSTSPSWDLEGIKKTFSKDSLFLSEDEIEMYDELGRYLVSSKSLDIGFHVYVCGYSHPVCSRDLTPYYDSHYPLHGVFYLDTENAIAALEKYKGYQLSVEITEGSFHTNENTKKAQQVFDVLKTCNGNKKNVAYKKLDQYGDMGFVVREYYLRTI